MDEERVKNLIKNLIIEIGEDPTREGLRDTPKRIAKMYKEIFGGYESDSQIGVQFSEDSDTVIVKNIEFYSMCEHHMKTAVLWQNTHSIFTERTRIWSLKINPSSRKISLLKDCKFKNALLRPI